MSVGTLIDRGVASHLDITERKQIEDELRKHRDHLEELVTERTNKLITAWGWRFVTASPPGTTSL